MVFYRKYRPQIIDDLDSASVRETLVAVLQKEAPHAFLFTGPKGLGKTSTARIVAKVVNCTTEKSKRKNGIEPCDTCDACVSIKNGTNIDVLEIDAASNRGIDEIRELKEKIRLAPVSAKRKVYIIDEVHMLTTEAFNALLKTLEEPPDHAMFILCTTESHKVPETIVSRCFQIKFKPATDKEIARSLERIVANEKITISSKEKEDILRVISQVSDGGFRDAAKMLEEITLIANGEEITSKFIEEKYHIDESADNAKKLVSYMIENKTKEALELLEMLIKQGIDIKFLIGQVMNLLHQRLLWAFKINETESINTDLGPNESLKNLKTDTIAALYDHFSIAYQSMKNAVLPQLPLEIAVIEWCEMAKNPQASNDAGSTTQKSYVAQNVEVSVSSLRKQVGTMKKLKAMYGSTPAPVKKSDDDEVTVTTSVELMQTNGDGAVTKEWMELFWRSLINEMKKYNHTVAGVLRGCTIKSYENQQLIIQTAYKFHKERLDDMKNHDSLMKISKLLTGKEIEITVELKK